MDFYFSEFTSRRGAKTIYVIIINIVSKQFFLISHQVTHNVLSNSRETPPPLTLLSNHRLEGEKRPSGTSVLHCVIISH